MYRGASVAAFGLGIFLSLAASAGTMVTVRTIDGALSLNRGEGYVEVLSWAEAPAGSQVMANPGSKGKIIYSDGCTIDVVPGSVYTVQDSSPCSSGVVGRPRAYYVIGGLVVAGGAVAIIALTGGSDSDNGKQKKKKHKDTDNPASP